jgi:hypothetical protein
MRADRKILISFLKPADQFYPFLKFSPYNLSSNYLDANPKETVQPTVQQTVGWTVGGTVGWTVSWTVGWTVCWTVGWTVSLGFASK